MAAKNKVDLTMGIAMGSSIQIALFVAPLLVLLSFFIRSTTIILNFQQGRNRSRSHGSFIDSRNSRRWKVQLV